MKLAIEYIDQNRATTNRAERISYLALIKHLGVAGQGFAPTIIKFKRMLGLFLLFTDYLDPKSLRSSHFGTPPNNRYDPTEKSQFSTFVGKALGDFLAKRLSQAKLTVNYEAAMKQRGLPIRGKRPDLFCTDGAKDFALEAKGFSAKYVGPGKMTKHNPKVARLRSISL